jgi:hypothetical protein
LDDASAKDGPKTFVGFLAGAAAIDLWPAVREWRLPAWGNQSTEGQTRWKK